MKNKLQILLLMGAVSLLPAACTSETTGTADASGSGGQTGENFVVETPVFPEGEFLITDYGAVNDGLTLNTEAINSAIRACHEAGGGKVVIPSGVWVTGPIRLRSNVNLHAAEGSVVMFSKDFDDYPFVRTYFEGQQDLRAMPLLFGDSIENIAITGKGIFDGSGDIWRPVKKFKMTDGQWRELLRSGGALNDRGDIWWPSKYAYEASLDPASFRDRSPDDPELDKYKPYFRPPLLQLIHCDRVLLEGPIFENSPGWCLHPLMCTNLTVNDITVRNPWYSQNGDGIDVESCEYVSIRNSQFDVGDDAICIKSGRNKEGRDRGRPTRYVVVDNCIVHHGHGGFVVGSEMSGGVSDIWVRNCSFTGTDVGLRFKSTRGRGGVVENIHIENIRMINIARDAIIFNLFYAGLAPTEMGEDPIGNLIANAPEVSEETPEFRNIHISNVSCQGADRAIQILGLPEMPVSNLTVENAVFKTDRGINCLFASDLTLSNVRVVTNGQPVATLVNVMDVEINSLDGNNDVLLELDGEKSTGVSVKTEDPDQFRQRTRIGEKAAEDALKISGL